MAALPWCIELQQHCVFVSHKRVKVGVPENEHPILLLNFRVIVFLLLILLVVLFFLLEGTVFIGV